MDDRAGLPFLKVAARPARETNARSRFAVVGREFDDRQEDPVLVGTSGSAQDG